MALGDSQEFFLDIEAKVNGDTAIGQLAALEDSLSGAMKRYQQFESAGLSAAKGLEKTTAQIEAVRSKMATAMAVGDEKSFWKGAAAVDALTKKQAELAKKVADSKTALDAEGKSITKLADDVAKQKKAEKGGLDPTDAANFGKGLKKLGGPLGDIGGVVNKVSIGWKKLSGSIGSSGAAAVFGAVGLVALAAAVVAVVAAVAVGVVAIAKWSIGLADQNRDLSLTISAMSKTAGEADGLSAAFDNITHETGISADRLVALTRELKAAHISAKQMPDALRAIALQEQALGDTSGTSTLIDQLKYGQVQAGKLSETMDKKFGGIVQQRMLSLTAQSATFQRNLSDTFGGLNIDGFLEGLSKLVGLLDSSSESGQAIKTLFEAMFQPLLDASVDVFPKIERGLLMIEIVALEVAIKFKTMMKNVDSQPLKDFLDIASGPAWEIFHAVLEAIAGSFFLMIKGTIEMISLASSLDTAAQKLGGTIGTFLADAFKTASGWAAQFTSIGQSIIAGIVNALTSGSKLVTDAVNGIADNAIASAKAKLKISSPSQVFVDIGENTALGFVHGVESQNDNAGTALERLVEPPAGGGDVSSSQKSLDLSVGDIHIHGVDGAKDVAPSLRDELGDLFRTWGDQMGGEPEAA